MVQGYSKETFIIGRHSSAIGSVKQTTSELDLGDKWGTILARCGIGRSSYAIEPGLYCIGEPDQSSPVLVTANYKLSFDHLRRELKAIDAWILVLDTNGINVWCAAGKGTFATKELLYRIKESRLNEVVSHHRLIVPQLGATGVAGFQVKKQSGFRVIWGPIYAEDIKQFLSSGYKAENSMRQVRFSAKDRLVLTPVELNMLKKAALLIFICLTLISGINPEGYSLNAALSRGMLVLLSGLTGIITGAVIVPILLPWIPFRSFYLKGIVLGLIASGTLFNVMSTLTTLFDSIALMLFVVALSSYLAMNFTGSTPYTSPTGVEKEMKRGIPFQLVSSVVALVIWVTSPFIT